MRIFNADGSEGKMCGNAIRCVGKYLWDSRAVRETTLTVETLSGVKTLTLRTNGAAVSSVSVDMGYAEFAPEKIPVLSGGKMIGSEITAGGMRARVTALSVGNPHAVVFCGDIASLDLEKIGSAFEHHPLFPERVNTEFVRIISRTEIEMRVWERGLRRDVGVRHGSVRRGMRRGRKLLLRRRNRCARPPSRRRTDGPRRRRPPDHDGGRRGAGIRRNL